MIGSIFRFVWVVWVTVVCLHYCSVSHYPAVQTAYGNDWSLDETMGVIPVKKAPPPAIAPSMGYTVVAGDTLSAIADRYGTTWEKLWDINRDRIADPNLIHVGQKIRTRGAEIVVPPKPQLTREQKVDKLAKFMFKKAGLAYETKKGLEDGIKSSHDSLIGCGLTLLDNQRRIMDGLYTKTRQYEIWILTEAIIDQTQTDDELYKLVGLTWQETQFVNRRGRHGEVSFYQFLPSTIKWWYDTDDIGKVVQLYELENNPAKATALALEMLRKCNWNWNWWNRGSDYEYYLNSKIYQFKIEWRK